MKDPRRIRLVTRHNGEEARYDIDLSNVEDGTVISIERLRADGVTAESRQLYPLETGYKPLPRSPWKETNER